MGKLSTQRKYLEKYFTHIHIPTPRHEKKQRKIFCWHGMPACLYLFSLGLKCLDLLILKGSFFYLTRKKKSLRIREEIIMIMN